MSLVPVDFRIFYYSVRVICSRPSSSTFYSYHSLWYDALWSCSLCLRVSIVCHGLVFILFRKVRVSLAKSNTPYYLSSFLSILFSSFFPLHLDFGVLPTLFVCFYFTFVFHYRITSYIFIFFIFLYAVRTLFFVFTLIIFSSVETSFWLFPFYSLFIFLISHRCLLCSFNIRIILLDLSYFLQAIYFVLLVHRTRVLWVFLHLCSTRTVESCYPFRRAPFASRCCAHVSNETVSSASRNINTGYTAPILFSSSICSMFFVWLPRRRHRTASELPRLAPFSKPAVVIVELISISAFRYSRTVKFPCSVSTPTSPIVLSNILPFVESFFPQIYKCH